MEREISGVFHPFLKITSYDSNKKTRKNDSKIKKVALNRPEAVVSDCILHPDRSIPRQITFVPKSLDLKMASG